MFRRRGEGGREGERAKAGANGKAMTLASDVRRVNIAFGFLFFQR